MVVQTLTDTQWLVLNATADDMENLERIYRSLALSLCVVPDENAGSYQWQEHKNAPLLSEVADAVRFFVENALFRVYVEAGDTFDVNDLSYVWRGWFAMTPAGRSLFDVSHDIINALF